MARLPVACSLTDTELRHRRETLLRTIAGNVSGSSELENGFAYDFPIATGPKQIVRSGYDRVSHAYRSEAFDYERSEYRAFLRWLEPLLAPGSIVLDLGCGCGVPVSSPP